MEKEVQYFLECAHKCAEAGLLSCSSGNLSLRCKGQDNEDCALISATGSWLGELREDQVALCCISDGTPLNGVRPTMEAGFHLGTMRKRPEVGCVLHFQSPCATVVACMKDKPRDFNVTLEGPLYVGRDIPVVPFLPPGSPELAAAVVEALTAHDIVLMSNHGQVACGPDFPDTPRQLHHHMIILPGKTHSEDSSAAAGTFSEEYPGHNTLRPSLPAVPYFSVWPSQ